MALSMDVYKFTRIDPAISPRPQESDPNVPVARSGHRIVVTDSDLYSLGGYNPEYWDVQNTEDTYYPLFKEENAYKSPKEDVYSIDLKPLQLWQFNFVTRKWKKLNTTGFMPLELASHAAVRHNNNMIAFGGTGVPFGESSSNDLHVCNLSTHNWQHYKCTGEHPEKKYGHAMLLADQYLYVCGGTTGFVYNMDVHRLDLRTLVWEKLSSDKMLQNEPECRYRHEMAYYNNRLYIFGGGTAFEAFRFELMPTFNITERVWEKTPAVSDRQYDVYMCGGMDGVKILPDLWRLSLETHHWTKLKHDMQLPAYFHAADLAPNGCMYIFGGVTAIDSVRTREVYRVWLKVPLLQELAWNCVVGALPNPDTICKHELTQIGVPAHLVERIS